MCKYSFLFQCKTKTDSLEDLTKWFHKFVKETFLENIHSDCDKKILNLRSMIKAISNNNGMSINDVEYSRKLKLKLAGITYFKWDQYKKGQGIQIYNNGEGLFLNETCYAFRSIVSSIVKIKKFEII